MDSLTYNFAMNTVGTAKRAVTSLSSLPSQSNQSYVSDNSYCKHSLIVIDDNLFIDGKFEPLITANHTMSSYALEAENQELRAHITKMVSQLDKITRGSNSLENTRNSLAYNTFNTHQFNPLDRELFSANQMFEDTLAEFNNLATRLKQVNDPIYVAEIAKRTEKTKAQAIKVQKETEKAMKAADVDEKVLKAIESGKREPFLLQEANEISSKCAKAQRKLESLQDKNSNFSLEKEIKEERLKELEDICENLESIERYYFGREAVESPKVDEYISAAVEVHAEAYLGYELQVHQTNDKYYKAQLVEDIESLTVENAQEREHLERLDNIVKEQRELINEIIAENRSKSEREIKAIMGRTLEDWEEIERREAEEEALRYELSQRSRRGLSTPPSLSSTDGDGFKKTKKVVFSHVIREESEATDSPQIAFNKASVNADAAKILIKENDIKLDDEKREVVDSMTKEEKVQIAKFLLNGESSEQEKTKTAPIMEEGAEMKEEGQNEPLDLDGAHKDETEEVKDNSTTKIELTASHKASVSIEEGMVMDILETTVTAATAAATQNDVDMIMVAEKIPTPKQNESTEVKVEEVAPEDEKEKTVQTVVVDAEELKVEEVSVEGAQEGQEAVEQPKTEEQVQTVDQQTGAEEEEKIQEEPSAGINSKPVFKRSIRTKSPKLAEAQKTTADNGEQTEEAMFAEKKDGVAEVSVQAGDGVAVEVLAERQATEKTIGAGEEVVSQRFCTDEVGVQAGTSAIIGEISVVEDGPSEKEKEELVLPECMMTTKTVAPVATKDASVGTIELEEDDEYNRSDFFSVGESQISSFKESKTFNQTAFSVQRTTFNNTGFGSTGRINKLRMGTNQDLVNTLSSRKTLSEKKEEEEKIKLEKQREQIKKKLFTSNKRPQSRGRYITKGNQVSKGCGPDEVNTVHERVDDSMTASSAWEYSRDASMTNGSMTIMASIMVMKPKKVSIAVGTDGYFDPDMSLGGEHEVEEHQTINKKRVPIKKKLMAKGAGNFFN